MEKPILFNTEMVNAILGGKKTVTRRLVKRDISIVGEYIEARRCYPDGTMAKTRMHRDGFVQTFAPFKEGDILYIRETWAKIPGASSKGGFAYKYKASEEGRYWDKVSGFKWKPSIHMPKEAARIWLTVTDVRLMRLHNMSDDDARSEGTENLEAFAKLWDTTVDGADIARYSWDADPWIWVIGFERIDKPEQS